jgi:phosphoribosylformylglycinamidine cyclo-ligase
MKEGEGLNYRQAGVDIEAGDRTVALIRERVRSSRPEVTAGIGGFYGGFRLPDGTTLVAGTDGVGTKLLLARDLKRWDTVGTDLVAMSVNDVLTAGAEPLFFLDYVATGRLDPHQVATVVAGIDAALVEVGAVLLGGETAEMPGLYQAGDLDLAGFAVGRIVPDRVPAPRVTAGQAVVGLAASGPHSNGFSLLRRVVADTGRTWEQPVGPEGPSLADWALRPTRLYVRPVLDIIRRWPVAAMAHITGGGIPGNLPRGLGGKGVRLDERAWDCPEPFRLIQQWGGVSLEEMRRVFNMGIGYCLVLEPGDAPAVTRHLQELGFPAWVIGTVTDDAGVVYQ